MTDPIKLSSSEETLNSANQVPLDSATNVVELKTKIAELAALHPLEYDLERKATAKQFNVQIKTLDTEVKAAKKDLEKPQSSFLEAVIPYADPIVPSDLFEEIRQVIHQHIILDLPQGYSLTLWATMTWMMDCFQVAPLAIINAPEKACGKTQLLEIMGRICCRSIPLSNMTTASMFRVTEQYQPTLLIDEVDLFIKENKEILGLINAGHTRSSSFVIRIVGDNHEPKFFNVFGPKLVAGIALEKHLPDSTLSRGLIINMRRKLSHESVVSLRHADIKKFEVIKAKLARFALDYAEQVSQAQPKLPESLSDRAQDNWSPLMAIAECAGETWTLAAYHAALKLSSTVDESLSIGAELLTDIRTLFETKNIERISSVDLILALVDDEERPWLTYNRGKQISPRQVATILKTYGIHSKTVRMPYNKTPKGYTASEFKDAFTRYLAADTRSADEGDF